MARKPLHFPLPILCDAQEKPPYQFTNLHGDARHHGDPILVQTKTCSLLTGDYSLDRFSEEVAIERKSHADFFKTIIQGREAFVAELARLNKLDFGEVIVESELSALQTDDSITVAKRKSCLRSVMSWRVKFRRVGWWFVDGRRAAEILTFRLLQKYLEHHGHDLERR